MGGVPGGGKSGSPGDGDWGLAGGGGAAAPGNCCRIPTKSGLIKPSKARGGGDGVVGAQLAQMPRRSSATCPLHIPSPRVFSPSYLPSSSLLPSFPPISWSRFYPYFSSSPLISVLFMPFRVLFSSLIFHSLASLRFTAFPRLVQSQKLPRVCSRAVAGNNHQSNAGHSRGLMVCVRPKAAWLVEQTLSISPKNVQRNTGELRFIVHFLKKCTNQYADLRLTVHLL